MYILRVWLKRFGAWLAAGWTGLSARAAWRERAPGCRRLPAATDRWTSERGRLLGGKAPAAAACETRQTASATACPNSDLVAELWTNYSGELVEGLNYFYQLNIFCGYYHLLQKSAVARPVRPRAAAGGAAAANAVASR